MSDATAAEVQDWGGSIGKSLAAQRSERVRGLVFMNTWFWPADRLAMHLFSRIMSTLRMRWLILHRNIFGETFIPLGVRRKLSTAEMSLYREVQPTHRARQEIAEFAHQVVAAGPWLDDMARQAPRVLRYAPVVLVWGMQDPAFGQRAVIERWRTCFPHAEVVLVPQAGHYVPEDAPDQVVEAVTRRFSEAMPHMPVDLGNQKAGRFGRL